MPDKSISRGCLAALTAARGRSGGLLAVLLLLSGCGLFITPQHRIAVAKRDISAGNWQEAAIELRAVIQRDGNNAEAWQLLAEISLDAADLEGAQSALGHALAAGAKGPAIDALRLRLWLAAGQPKEVLDAIAHHTVAPGEPTESLAQAKADTAMGHPDEAVRVLQPILAQQPQLTEARVAIAEALAREGEVDAALAQIALALQADARSPLPLLLQGRILAARGQYAAAEKSVSLAIQCMPRTQPLQDRERALALLTEVRLAQRRIDAAAQSQVALANLIPTAPVCELLGARIQLARGNLDAAVDELGGVVAQAPDYLKARLYLGAAELTRGDLQLAEEQLQQVVQRAPDDAQAKLLLAVVRLRILRQTLESKLQADPSSVPVRLALAEILTGTKDFAQARAVLQPIDRPGADPRVKLAMARIDLAQGDLKSAQAALEAALQGSPDNLVALNNLAWVYGKLGDPRAEALAERAYRIAPGSAAVDDTLGWILARRRETVRAAPLLAHAVGLAPADPDIEYHYAYTLVADGKRDEARQILTRILLTSRPFDSRADAARLLASVKSN